MAAYTLNILSVDGRVREKRVIHAVRNYDAVKIAEELAQAMTDSGGYEVWFRKRSIFRQATSTSQRSKA